MPLKVDGKFEVVDSNGKAILTKDPDSSFIQINYTGVSGLHIIQATNTASLNLWGANPNILNPGAEKFGARLDGSVATLFLGGNGTAGKVVVNDAKGKEIVHLNADAASKKAGVMALRNGAGHDSIFLDGNAGDIFLNDKNGKTVIYLNADAAGDNLQIKDGTAKILLAFDNEAINNTRAGLFVGGHVTQGGGKAGVMALRNDAGNDSIFLDGNAGDIFLKDKNGKTVIYLNADAAGNNLQIQEATGKILLAFDNEAFNGTRAGLFLGGHVTQGGGKAGVMALRNDAGNDSIFLDGSAGDITFSNADCAEEFDIAGAADIAPGTVMVLDHEGLLRESVQAYDRKVAGVISGAGGYKPGIVLDRQKEPGRRLPVALIGKVYCKVDAEYSPVEVGDLLATSPTPGHAMRAADPARAFGAVLGKALRSQAAGRGLIPILVSLQ